MIAGKYTQEHPFWARVSACRYLTHPECQKRVIHFALDISGANLKFEPGDAIALAPGNSPLLVDALLTRISMDGHMYGSMNCLPPSSHVVLACSTHAACQPAPTAFDSVPPVFS